MRTLRRFALVLTMLAPSVAAAWVTSFGPEQGAPAHGRIALDAAGNAVAATASKGRLTVVRYETATGRRTWSATLVDEGRPSGVAVDGAGNALVAGFHPIDPFTSNADQVVVAKLDGARGTVRWRLDFPGTRPSGVAVGSADAAFVGWENGPFGMNVAKLDAATGTAVWTRGWFLLGNPAVAVDPSNDVVVAAARTDEPGVRVIKLDQATGATIWDVETSFAVTPFDVSVTTDASGNAYVVAGLILKLAAATGAELWRTVGTSTSRHPTVAANGDLVLSTGGQGVVRYDGATGAVRWSRSNADLDSLWVSPPALIDATDDVLVLTGDLTLRRLVALDGLTGVTVWEVPILGGDNLAAIDVALGPAGLAGVGYLSAGNGPAASSMLLGIGARLAGTKLALKDVAGDPAKSTFEVQSKDPRLTPPYPTGAPQDPTVGGATVTIENPNTLETGVITLPAAGWTVRAPAGKVGRESYKYKDASCTATVQSGKRLLVKCKGTLGGFTLDEASQGSLRVTIVFGAGGHPYCTAFGGQILQDVGTAGTGTGSFLAREALAPATCPGAF